ncbi:MAG: YdcF family protein [Ferruginibacter sp.]|uniref:YdcF family protein n=1 Tax=Ferruginibacter sp. TaxID=1940288 RepID=UPI00265924FA|nr:YdcF family protein [Ferruginibacter sp.]MDB5279864.1 YdcF family protein [Ferruginibacter sp.]
MLPPEINTLAQQLWNYHHMQHDLVKADCILALGSHDLRVADRAAELYLQGWAPLVIMSGGLGNLTQNMWTESEADKFARIAIENGVPADAILVENKSTNTGENILFTQQLLQQKGLDLHSFIVVQKPYMERRSYATFKKHWPGKHLLVTSPQIDLVDYPTDDIPMERVINIMVGDLQRVRFYPGKGFQIYQDIPADIWAAYEQLIALGFDKHLMKD